MTTGVPKAVPLTCHGHSRPVTHLNFSSVVEEDQYYLISACKDNHAMLRDGITGDWIGTFIGHKGAVWSSRLSSDAALAATGSADFTAKVWDTHTGECIHTLQHAHIVKAVSFPLQFTPTCVATGGMEKKLRIFDLSHSSISTTTTSLEGGPAKINTSTEMEGIEVGSGVHTAPIKSIVWNVDYNILTSASEDKTIRWWDLRTRRPACTYTTENQITSCELNTLQSLGASDSGILAVAAGESCFFFAAGRPGEMIKRVDFDHEIASVAVNAETGRFVTGGMKDTWVRVWDWETERELDVQKGHHGSIWSTSYSPDGKLYATGSEDGTIKLWKACKEQYGLWRV